MRLLASLAACPSHAIDVKPGETWHPRCPGAAHLMCQHAPENVIPRSASTCSPHLLDDHAQNPNGVTKEREVTKRRTTRRSRRRDRSGQEVGSGGRRENKQKTECLGGKEGQREGGIGGREALAECLGGV